MKSLAERAEKTLPEFYRPVCRGILSRLQETRAPELGKGGAYSPRYCYSVWLRHLVMADRHGLNTSPGVVAELGPGGSLGVGLAALLCGAEQYLAFDVLPYASLERNLEMLDALVPLIRNRQPIPGPDEFPATRPSLDSYDFPKRILPNERLQEGSRRERVESIRRALREPSRCSTGEAPISYIAPWDDPGVVQPESVDMIVSQAVMEHVRDLPGTYASFHRWLRAGGFISHQIDFRSHGITKEWNGHWKYSDFWWWLVKGKSEHVLNREPHSRHARLAEEAGLSVVCDLRFEADSEISRSELADRFKDMSQKDLTTYGAFIQAVKSI